jgi:hypothetical protein
MHTKSTLSVENELPLSAPPDIPLWSENFCLQAWDPRAALGVWLHMGLPVYDAGLWHDITVVYLPGGEDLLVVKSFAPREWQQGFGPAGAMLRADYDAATGEWVWRFHGIAHRTTRSQLHRALMHEAAAEPLRFELRFSGLSRVWDLTHYVGEQAWATDGAHWEQPCAVHGVIEVGGKRHDFSGTGIRDHSRGKRDTTHFGPHFWLHGAFPSGRCFGLLYVSGMPGQPVTLNRAYAVYDGVLEDAEVLALPADRLFPQPFEIRLRDRKGTHTIRGELLHDMTFSFFAPNEILIGRDVQRAERFLNEGQIRWTWDGETGYGLGERTVRIGSDRQPDEASSHAVIPG